MDRDDTRAPTDDDLTAERLTRNWEELLQEIRVTQTGVQILTGFLLMVPFSAGFLDLSGRQRVIYLVVLAGSILTTGLAMAPVALHRTLFRHRRRELLVDVGQVCATSALATLALTIAGVAQLAVEVVLGESLGWIGFTVTLVVFAVLWFVLGPVLDRLDKRPRLPPPD